MSERRTAWLAVAFAALAVYFFAVEGARLRPAPPEWQQADKILACPPDGPDEITVESTRGQVTAKRNGDDWSAAAGGLASGAFADLAKALCELPIIDRIPDVKSFGDFGLEPPSSRVAVVNGGQRQTVAVGDATPADNLMYVRIDERPEVLKVGVLFRFEVEKVAAYAGRS